MFSGEILIIISENEKGKKNLKLRAIKDGFY